MNKNDKSLLLNPWIIATGSGILVILVMRLLDFFIGTKILQSFWNILKSLFLGIVDFFLLKFEVSLWFLIVLPLIVVGLIIFVLWIILTSKNNDVTPVINPRPLFLDYTEENFGGILYCWEYIKDFTDKYEIRNIAKYCPKCRCLIVDNKCPVCNTYLQHYVKSNQEIAALIKHRIDTRIMKQN